VSDGDAGRASETTVRLPLRFTATMATIGAVFGTSPRSSWVEVDDGDLRARMGIMAAATVPRSHIVDARPMEWARWAGFGVRWYGPRRWGLIASTAGVIELVLDPPTRMRMILPVRAKRLALSMDDPDHLLRLLGFAP
jgi:hypothetical protein